jgi:hypothetical protein
MRKSLININGTVVNIIEIEPDAMYTPPEGLTMLDEHPDAVIGGSYDSTTGLYSPPPDPTNPPAGDGGHAR